MYQPEWRDGREVGKGRRDAAGRYEAIAGYLGDARDFTALDFGAYGNYFSARLVEQFNARCTAVDDTTGLAESPGVSVVNRRLSAQELKDLGPYDVALCLSVLHHLTDWRVYLDALLDIAPVLFVETAHPDEVLPKAKAHSQSREIESALDALAAEGGTILTFTPGYDSRHARPLWVIDRRPAKDAAEVAPGTDEAPTGERKPAPVKRTRRRRTPKPE